MEYRIHLTVRGKGEPVFTSQELKTESFDDLEDLMEHATDFVKESIEEDLEGRDDTDVS